MVIRLQLVLKALEELGTSLLNEDAPLLVLKFIFHIVESHSSIDTPAVEPELPKESHASLRLSDLRLIDETSQPSSQLDGLADDLAPSTSFDNELQTTALTLLIAVLESKSIFSSEEIAILKLIDPRLGQFVQNDGPSTIKILSRQAKMILRIQIMQDLMPVAPSESVDPLAPSRVKYQEALRLLKDSILPVRAQGLVLLRTLVQNGSTTDAALYPAILDIFFRTLEDTDSFLYLNAINGLGAMADIEGRKVYQRMIQGYTFAAIHSSAKEQQEQLDKKLRIGEALEQVVRTAGTTVAAYCELAACSTLHLMNPFDSDHAGSTLDVCF